MDSGLVGNVLFGIWLVRSGAGGDGGVSVFPFVSLSHFLFSFLF